MLRGSRLQNTAVVDALLGTRPDARLEFRINPFPLRSRAGAARADWLVAIPALAETADCRLRSMAGTGEIDTDPSPRRSPFVRHWPRRLRSARLAQEAEGASGRLVASKDNFGRAAERRRFCLFRSRLTD